MSFRYFEAQVASHVDRLNRITDFFATATPKLIFQAEANFQELEKLELSFKLLSDEVLKFNASLEGEDDTFVGIDTNEFYEVVTTCKAKYLKLKSESDSKASVPANENTPSTSKSRPVALQPIRIPTFDGEITEFEGFRSMFESLVHQNQDLSEIEKFYHLRSVLSGPALSLIEAFKLTENNYQDAYKTLITHYEATRIHAQSYLGNIHSYGVGHEKKGKFSYSEFVKIHANNVRGLKNLSKLNNLEDFLLFDMAYRNLPKHVARGFDIQNKKEVPSFDDLLSYMNSFAVAEQCSSGQLETPKKAFLGSQTKEIKLSCQLGDGQHKLSNCKLFIAKTPNERYEIAKKFRLCINCLKTHQGGSRECKEKGCDKCRWKHHPLLHFGKYDKEKSAEKGSSEGKADPNSQNCLTCTNIEEALLGTVIGYVRDSFGQKVKVRAVLDGGSTGNLCTSKLVHRLGLQRKRCNESVLGLGDSPTTSLGRVEIEFYSAISDFKIAINANVIDHITDKLPVRSLPSSLRDKVEGLPLADENFDKPGLVDLLLDVNVWCEVIDVDQHGASFVKGQPSRQFTKFGWVIMGKVPDIKSVSFAFLVPPTTDIRRLWEMEADLKTPHEEDEFCERHFKENTTRVKGRFQIKFPFKDSEPDIGSNRPLALKNFFALEKKLSDESELKVQYHKVMQGYLQDGYMHQVFGKGTYLLPQLTIEKPESTTTKTRVVFNSSSRSNNGKTLNDEMYTGPQLLREVVDILHHFRFHKVAICADIAKCYHQILVHPDHQKYQRIFYRKETDLPLQEYEFSVLLFGTSAAPFLCQRVIQELAVEESGDLSAAAEAVQCSMYLDNFTGGSESVESGLVLRDSLIELFNRGGFVLRKFSSSHKEILEGLDQELKETPVKLDNDDVIKILGLCYNPESDSFEFSFQAFKGKVTRRSILSYTARVFDPLGFLAPITFWQKYAFQQTFTHDQKVDWDQELNEPARGEWLRFVEELGSVKNLKIPRFVECTGSNTLVGFSDASKKGYSAVVYLHSEDNGLVTTHLIRAKTKLAPLKGLTIPRMELNGALLLAELVYSTKEQSKIHFDRTVLYIDSQVVLHWIKSEPQVLETYISNRVCKIKALTANVELRFVPSKLNAADQACRGMMPATFLTENELWWFGPGFLQSPYEQWPVFWSSDTCKPLEEKDKSTDIQILYYGNIEGKDGLYEVTEKFSRWTRLVGVFGYVLRFIRACRKEVKSKSGGIQLSLVERREAEKMIVKVVQGQHFSKEKYKIELGKTDSGRLSALNPFIDEDGVIRVGGRLRNAKVEYNMRHPYILPKDCQVSRLLIQTYHTNFLHVGPTTLKSLLRQKFWIVSGHTLIRKIVRQCVRCLRFKGKTHQQMMGDLPVSRLQVSKPFTYTAMDMAGPFDVKASKLRNSKILKGYLLVLVCQTYRAVHLEFCSEMSTICLIAALQRFVARRGLPKHFLCDNGKNFVGLKNHLQLVKDFFKAKGEEIQHFLESMEIEFHFTPPYSPSGLAGSWEAQVKLAKQLIYREYQGRPLTVEEYFTVFARAEAVINSRPLVETGEDSEAIFELTPAHFLVGTRLYEIPEVDMLSGKNETLTNRWKLLLQTSQKFAKRFKIEYLNQLTKRTKWKKSNYEPKVDQVVYITDMYTSPLEYPIGKIEKLHTGKDGITRVVTVRLPNGKLTTRGVNKLILFK